MIDTSLVTISFHTAPSEMARFLSEVTELTPYKDGQLELIVVNNGGMPNITIPDRVKVIEAGSNLGFGAGFNLGLRAAAGRTVICINQDVTITSDVIAKCRAATMGSDLTLVAPPLTTDWGEETGLAFYTPWRLLLARTPLRRMGRSRDHPFWVPGAFMAMSRHDWDSLGGFDDSYFLYFEDVDLCWRVWEAGGGVRILDTGPLYHRKARASRRLSKVLLHHLRSALVYFTKHPRAIIGLGPGKE